MFLIYLLLLDFQINSHLYDFRLKDTMKKSIIFMIMRMLYITFLPWSDVWRVFLPISSQCSITILPGYIRKPLLLGCFQMA